ncbi:hypothetical protein ACIO6T_44645 [Streptomyces sp. NPDC087532]|uniref:hypothetical protein n=1 Tax=Streptomyces sp. NPDC087532 TaxID=3365795 RepID=UPI00382C8201
MSGSHGYNWGDIREIKASDLNTGDVFVNPGLGTAYAVKSDGRVEGAGIAWEMPLNGTAWTVVARMGQSVTAVSHVGRMVQAELSQTAIVLRVSESPERPESVLANESWRGGQWCGFQTAYGLPHAEFCGQPKALGLRLCQQHHDDLGAEIRYWAPGNAEGLALVRTIHGWSVYDQYGDLCASSDGRALLEHTYGFSLAWEGSRGEPVQPAEVEYAP